MSAITLVRRIKARPSIVFDALTTAEGMAAWRGPDDLPVVHAEVDARVDGAYRVRFRSRDGRDHEACGTFLELVPPHRIVMTNATAARTQLPQFLKRTEWVLSGASRQELIERTRSAFASRTFMNPEPGALSYMLSKSGYVSDDAAGPWLPHMMFYVPRGQAAVWGAGADGSPIIGRDGSDIESTVLLIPVRRWSDGSSAAPDASLIR